MADASHVLRSKSSTRIPRSLTLLAPSKHEILSSAPVTLLASPKLNWRGSSASPISAYIKSCVVAGSRGQGVTGLLRTASPECSRDPRFTVPFLLLLLRRRFGRSRADNLGTRDKRAVPSHLVRCAGVWRTNPIRSSAAIISGFAMHERHGRPVRQFSIMTTIGAWFSPIKIGET